MTDNANTLSDAARHVIFNLLNRDLFSAIEYADPDFWERVHQGIGARSLNLTYDEVIYSDIDRNKLYPYYKEKLKSFLLQGEEKDVIKCLEFLLEDFSRVQRSLVRKLGKSKYHMVYDTYQKHLAYIFNKYNVGYKVIGLKIVPLTDEEETQEMERVPFGNAKRHLEDALRHLSDAEKPDYLKSMNESILAVESAAKELTNKDAATLADCIKVFKDKGIILHPAFEKALGSLYGFAGDNPGLRHARTKGKESLQEDYPTARFMFVTCSAFVNYLIANAPDGEK